MLWSKASRLPLAESSSRAPARCYPGMAALTRSARRIRQITVFLDSVKPWRRSESNRLRQRLQGAPATLAVIPVELARFELAAFCMPCRRSTGLSYSPMAAAAMPRRL